MSSRILALAVAAILAAATPVFLACGGDETPAPVPAEADASSVMCSSDDDCSPGPCRRRTCVAGRCEANASLDGTPLAAQTVGDCQRAVCAADGTTRSEADDSDAPVAVACRAVGCKGGVKTDEPLAKGAACAGGLCDGMGACAVGVGTPCSSPAQCPSGQCVDSVCCNSACTGECKSCNVDGTKGICADIPYYQEDTSYVPDGGGGPSACDLAVKGSKCNGKGKCLRISQVPCVQDAQCMSQKCGANKTCLGAKGEICNANGDCLSGTCAMGACT